MTHFMEVWTLWHANYWVAGFIKTLTAMASMATAIWLFKITPQAIAMATASARLSARELQLSLQTQELTKTNQSLLLEIEERQRVKGELQNREEDLRQVFEGIKDYAIITLDSEGLVTNWNDGARKIKGYELGEIIQQSFHKFYTPDDIASGKPDWALKEAARCGRFEDEGWRVRKDGSQFWANVIITVIRDSHSKNVCFSKFTRDLTEKKHAEDKMRMLNDSLEKKVSERTVKLETSIAELVKSEKSLKELTARLQSVQEEKRQRISRDIHDVLGQSLTVLKMDLFEIKDGLAQDQVQVSKERLVTTIASVDELVKTVRKVASELRPAALEHLGLVAAMEWWLRDFEKRTGLECRFSNNLESVQPEPEIATALFRILQEALTNVLRHSGSQKVEVRLLHLNDKIGLCIKDFGCGFGKVDAQDTTISLGIVGMRERASSMGGEFSFENVLGQGAVVIARIPLQRLAI